MTADSPSYPRQSGSGVPRVVLIIPAGGGAARLGGVDKTRLPLGSSSILATLLQATAAWDRIVVGHEAGDLGAQFPQVRFIGRPELEANDPYLLPWIAKVAGWIEEGRTPYVFLHTPDNHRAPELARRFHQQLSERLPGLPVLPELHQPSTVEQLGLL